MNFKQLIELIQSGLDDIQIADAIEFLGDTSTLMAELEHDHHMACIEIKKMQAEIDALKVGHARYETLRKLNVLQFRTIFLQNLKTGTPFDDLVDQLGSSK